MKLTQRPKTHSQTWYNCVVKLADVKLDKSVFKVFSSFEEADEDELMRQSAYGYDDPTTRRLQRVLEIVRGE